VSRKPSHFGACGWGVSTKAGLIENRESGSLSVCRWVLASIATILAVVFVGCSASLSFVRPDIPRVEELGTVTYYGAMSRRGGSRTSGYRGR